jgi:hypothetical protein
MTAIDLDNLLRRAKAEGCAVLLTPPARLELLAVVRPFEQLEDLLWQAASNAAVEQR